jgi:hypothetical protein
MIKVEFRYVSEGKALALTVPVVEGCVPMRCICTALRLDWATQYIILQQHPAQVFLKVPGVPSNRSLCLPISELTGWLRDKCGSPRLSRYPDRLQVLQHFAEHLAPTLQTAWDPVVKESALVTAEVQLAVERQQRRFDTTTYLDHPLTGADYFRKDLWQAFKVQGDDLNWCLAAGGDKLYRESTVVHRGVYAKAGGFRAQAGIKTGEGTFEKVTRRSEVLVAESYGYAEGKLLSLKSRSDLLLPLAIARQRGLLDQDPVHGPQGPALIGMKKISRKTGKVVEAGTYEVSHVVADRVERELLQNNQQEYTIHVA